MIDLYAIVLGGITAGGCIMAAIRWWRGTL